MKINGDKSYNLKLQLKDNHNLLNNKQLEITFDLNIHIFCNESGTLFKKDKFYNTRTIIEIPQIHAAFYSFEIKPIYSKCPVDGECPYLFNDTISCQKCRNILFYLHLNGTINHDEFKLITSYDLNSTVSEEFEPKSYFCSEFSESIGSNDDYATFRNKLIIILTVVLVACLAVVGFIIIYHCCCSKAPLNCKSIVISNLIL